VNVLVTGGAGFIGCELSHALARAGHHVVAIDNLHPQVHPRPERPARLHEDAELVVADVTDPRALDALLPQLRPETVVHLAAETGTGQSLTQASRHGTVNVVGTTQLLDALMRHDVAPRHLVLTSSRAVYGEGAWVAPDGTVVYPGVRRHDDLAAGRWDATLPDGTRLRPTPSAADRTEPRPTNVYAATKLAQEHICQAWTAATGSALSVLRLQNVYGPGQSLTNSYTGVVAFFARQASAGEVIDVYEDGEIVRDFVYVADVVQALAAAIAAPPRVSRTLDIGSGAPTTIRAAAALVAELRGAPAPQVSGRFRDGDVRAASCDIAAAQADLGYAPEWDLRRGLTALLAWITDGAE
jgi:dTDP-L-rhamnose 4-epimerase